MDKWTEIKTSYQVARLGTVRAAADVLGIHRATVIRHIDALEAELGGAHISSPQNRLRADGSG
jgi:DNA-binding transcriptional LysR family regulator